jgi:hypothetical protein
MQFERRSGFDRRSGKDRRKIQLPGFTDMEINKRRRSLVDRREPGERRKGFALVTKWSSVNLGIEI